MKILSLLGWIFYKVYTNTKWLFGITIIVYLVLLFVACKSSQKTQSSSIEEAAQSDSQYSHAKDYIDTSSHSSQEASSKTITEYTNPVITKDSAGNTVITASKIITTEEKKSKTVTDKKGITHHELTTITQHKTITKKATLFITKTVTVKSKWMIWLWIGAGLGMLISYLWRRYVPSLF